jgi:beta-glucanase (GH16 family)
MLVKAVFLLIIPFLIFSDGFSQSVNCFEKDKNAPAEVKGMELVWADEFNVNGMPDPANWKFEIGFVRNNELQWYQSDNVSCTNGILVLEGRKEKKRNPRYDSLSSDWRMKRAYASYTSASIKTEGLRYWQYGRFEIRARIDTSCGLWPAIWTLGNKGQWPWNGEIDLMEFYRINNKPHILANVAWGTTKQWVAKWDSEKKLLSDIMNGDNEWPEKFHIWRMDWNPDSICLYLDDRLLNTTQTKETINPDGSNPFHQPHYLLLNLAIGENGGDPSQTKFPVKYEVDYVRVYQEKRVMDN